MLVAECTNTASFQYQIWVIRNILPTPPARKSPENMSMRNDKHIEGLLDRSLRLPDRMGMESFPDIRNQRIKTLRNLLW